MLDEGDSAYACPAPLPRRWLAHHVRSLHRQQDRGQPGADRSGLCAWRTRSPTWAGSTRRGGRPTGRGPRPTRSSATSARCAGADQPRRSPARPTTAAAGGPAPPDAVAALLRGFADRRVDRRSGRCAWWTGRCRSSSARPSGSAPATCDRCSWAECRPSSSGSPARWTTWAARCATSWSPSSARPARSATARPTSPR